MIIKRPGEWSLSWPTISLRNNRTRWIIFFCKNRRSYFKFKISYIVLWKSVCWIRRNQVLANSFNSSVGTKPRSVKFSVSSCTTLLFAVFVISRLMSTPFWSTWPLVLVSFLNSIYRKEKKGVLDCSKTPILLCIKT